MSTMDDYLTAREAAVQIGISYSAVMARIQKGKIAAVRKGWALFIHKDEVKRAAAKDLEKSAR